MFSLLKYPFIDPVRSRGFLRQRKKKFRLQFTILYFRDVYFLKKAFKKALQIFFYCYSLNLVKNFQGKQLNFQVRSINKKYQTE